MTVLDLPTRPRTPRVKPKKKSAPAKAVAPPDCLMELDQLIPPDGYPFGLDQYLALSDEGHLPDRHVQFIDGEIIAMPAQRDDHAFSVTRSGRAADKVFPENDFWVRTQMTLLVNQAAPDPDVVVIPGPAKPGRGIPDASQALLVIEVSDSTLLYDRTVKAGLYAAGGIAEYVIVNVAERQLEVHRSPVADATRRFGHRYDAITLLKPGDTFTPLAAPDAAIPVGDFM